MLRRLSIAGMLAAWLWTPGLAAQDAVPAVPSAAESAPVRSPSFRPMEERARMRIARLEAEIAVLERLRDAQQALLAHNEGRQTLGASPAALDVRLCRDAAMRRWCAVLPATFGRRP